MSRFTFITSAAFWAAACERAVKTAAQSALLVLGADAFSAWSVDWLAVAGFAAGGAALSLLTSIGSGAATDGAPSLSGAEYLPERAA